MASSAKKYPSAAAACLSRGKFLSALPEHFFLALLFGAGGSILLDLLAQIKLPGPWINLPLFPSVAIFVNAMVLPLAIPGRHWSFAFLCEMMLILSCLAGVILATLIPLPHSTVAGNYLSTVNVITFLAMATGLSLGCFYGIVVGGAKALKLGALFGLTGGYLVGLLSTALISHETETLDQFEYGSLLDMAWQGGVGLLILHFFATIGALLGAKRQG